MVRCDYRVNVDYRGWERDCRGNVGSIKGLLMEKVCGNYRR